MMYFNRFKTALLLSVMSSVLFGFGYLIAGSSGMHVALIMALLFNFITYFFSDKIVLKMYRAQPLDEAKYYWLYDMVRQLCGQANMPMPKLWYIPTDMANAFATGRSPRHASVAVTQGILDILTHEELRGVLAHEISHVKNRDILVGTIAATMAAAVSYLGQMVQWAFIFGGSRSRNEKNGGGFGALFAAILMPIVASMLQLAISRSREYLADETGAKICNDPLSLASALEKLHDSKNAHRSAPASTAEAATASLFIVNPFTMRGMMHLFSTHPPMEERIKRLRAMARGR